MIWTILPAMIGGALGRRVAGGAFQQWTGLDIGDYPVRAFFGVMLFVAAVMGGFAALLASSLILSTFLGCSLPVGGIGMGREKDANYWRDVLTVSLHGIGSMAITAIPFALFPLWGKSGWDVVPFLIAGLLIAPMYEIGWRVCGPVFQPKFLTGFRGGSEWGECLWGACCGAAAWSVGLI